MTESTTVSKGVSQLETKLKQSIVQLLIMIVTADQMHPPFSKPSQAFKDVGKGFQIHNSSGLKIQPHFSAAQLHMNQTLQPKMPTSWSVLVLWYVVNIKSLQVYAWFKAS